MKVIKINGVMYYALLCMIVFFIGSCSGSDDEAKEAYLDVNTDYVLLKDGGGTVYLNIASNTKWTLFVDNEDVPIENLVITPLSGNEDETIKITYGSVQSKFPHEHARLIFYYYSNGDRVSKEVILSRESQLDDEPYITESLIVKNDNGSLITLDGYTLIFNSDDNFLGEMYHISYQYKKSKINEENKTIEIELLTSMCVDASTHIGNIEEYASNASIITINNEFPRPLFYDENILIIPVMFYVKEDLKKHTFELIYDPDSNQGNTLKLNLRHIDSEDQNQTLIAFVFRAFNLKSVFDSFGRKPDKVIIEYQSNRVNNNLENAVKSVFTVQYQF